MCDFIYCTVYYNDYIYRCIVINYVFVLELIFILFYSILFGFCLPVCVEAWLPHIQGHHL